MAVSKRLRYEILRRDSHTCRYCGRSAPDVPLRVDHVTPVALGGGDEPTNLATSCHDCNSGKSSASPDASLVAEVSDDALRWAAAMQQAADDLREQQAPKLAYRKTFQKAWSGWTREAGWKTEKVELPDGWKSSLDTFYEASLPQEVWPDIVEKAMTNPTVRVDNTFRYACGIAWRMVKELHERAGAIVGASSSPADSALDGRVAVLDAAFAVWFCGRSENEQAPTGQQKEEFRASLAALTDWDLTDPGRIVGAAQYATYFDINTIAEALRSTDRDRVWRAWFTAWPRTYVPGDTGDPWDSTCIGGPSDEAMEQVGEQIDKLLDAEVYVGRLERAASHAGIHKSARIYHGLDVDELKVTGVDLWRSRASELWRVAYTASGEVEPTKDETSRFFASLNSIGYDGEFCVADVYVAASAAGRYQDPDLTTCLPRRLSALEAAAQPLGGAA